MLTNVDPTLTNVRLRIYRKDLDMDGSSYDDLYMEYDFPISDGTIRLNLWQDQNVIFDGRRYSVKAVIDLYSLTLLPGSRI